MDSLPSCDVAADYAGAVGQLLSFGESGKYDPVGWPDYVAEFGVTQDDVDALIRMMGDPALNGASSESPRVWAQVHAWRALGQLGAKTAIDPLLYILGRDEDDDTAREEIPYVLGMIGPAAIVPVVVFLADSATPVWSAVGAVGAIKEIALRHPDCRDDCVGILARMLAADWAADATVAGFAILYLTELAAVETIDAIRDAFARDAVDISVVGDVEDAEIELGLRTARTTKGPPLLPWLTDRLTLDALLDQPRNVAPAPRRAAVGRNEPCPCGSGKKHKKCCL